MLLVAPFCSKTEISWSIVSAATLKFPRAEKWNWLNSDTSKRSHTTRVYEMKISWRISIFVVFFASLAFAQAPVSPLMDILKTWKLAFVRDKDIWVSNGDGTDQKLLIKNADNPSWSPNKKRIAFMRDCNLWVANSDGSKERPLTSHWKKDSCRMFASSISWNPKEPFITFSHPEKFIVYRSDTDGILERKSNLPQSICGNSIFDITVDGNSSTKAVSRFDIYEGGTSFNFADHANPAWSCSGEKLAFTRNGDIWIAEKEPAEQGEENLSLGWDVTRISATASYDEPTYRASRENHGATHFSWSPDEKYLAYSNIRLQGSGFAKLHLRDMKSGRDRVLADYALDPSFSPDGRFVAYWTYSGVQPKECGRSGCIWIISLDGKTKQMLVSDAVQPAWCH